MKFEDIFDPRLVDIAKGYGYWKIIQLKRKYGKYAAIYLDVFVAPGDNSLMKYLPKRKVHLNQYRWKEVEQ